MRSLKEAEPPASQRVCAMQGNITSSILQIGKLRYAYGKYIAQGYRRGQWQSSEQNPNLLATTSVF